MSRMISRVSTVRVENASCLRDLHDTISDRSANWSRVVVAIPQFSRADNQRLATRIRELHATCGCKSGATLGLAALGASVVWSVTHAAPLGVADLVMAVTAVLVGVVVGKLGGKAVARRTLMRELKQLASALSGVARPSSR